MGKNFIVGEVLQRCGKAVFLRQKFVEMATENLLKICPLTLTRVGGLPISELEKLRSDQSENFQKLDNLHEKQNGAAQNLFENLTRLLENLPDGDARTAVFNLRRQFFQKKKLPPQKLEAALEPLDLPAAEAARTAFSNCQNASRDLENHLQTFENQWFENLVENFAALQKFSETEIFRRSMLFASHDLLAAAPNFSLENSKKSRQTALAVWKYFSRAAAKTSPFSRLTTVHFSNENQPDEPFFFEENHSKISPNVALLEAIYDALLPHPTFFRSQKIGLNPSLVRVEKEFKFLFFDGQNESLQTLIVSPILEEISTYLFENQEVVSFESLKTALQNWTDEPAAECENYLLEIIEIGFLEWQLPEAGHSPNWCSGLISALQFLPAEPPISDTIFLLRNLQTAARTLPFQTVEQAAETQKNVCKQVQDFFKNLGKEPPPITQEQIFYEDVLKKPAGEILGKESRGAVEDLVKHLKANGLQIETLMQAAVQQFVEQTKPESDLPFPIFAGKFLEWRQRQSSQNFERKKLPLPSGKIGAMLQFFRGSDGELRAVINSIFPAGGGKMMQRWLPLAPENLQELKNWSAAMDEKIHAPFPWQSWHNTNFFQNLTGIEISVSDGRSGKSGLRKIRLADLQVHFSGAGQATLSFGNQAIALDDCGLEALRHRPPAMQLLWHLGVQNFSRDSLNSQAEWMATDVAGIFFSPRHEFGRVILRRAEWRFAELVWKNWLPPKGQNFQFFKNLVAAKTLLGLPDHCFFKFQGKPQLLDFQIAVSVLHFEKTLRQSVGDLFLVEMLPVPNSVLENHVSETVVEFETF